MSSCYSKKFCHKDKVSQHERLCRVWGKNDRADYHIKHNFLSKVLVQEPLLEHKGKSTERLKNSILCSECQTLILYRMTRNDWFV